MHKISDGISCVLPISYTIMGKIANDIGKNEFFDSYPSFLKK